MRVETIPTSELSGFARLFAQSPFLPLAYLPGVSREDCAVMQQRVLESKLAQGGRELLAVSRGGEAAGLALVETLPWDSGVYGFPMARLAALMAVPGAEEYAVKCALAEAARDRAQQRGACFVDAQAHLGDLKSVHALCAQGFRCMDTHVAIVWDLTKALPPAPASEAVVAEARPDDYADLISVSGRSYAPYSRFVVDDDLPRERAPEVFRQWAGNGLRGYADRVQLARIDGTAVGFCTWRIHKSSEQFLKLRFANLDLTGVLPEARGKGVLSAMVHDGLRWLQEQGIQYAEVLTHALNTGMQRGCSLLGGKTLAARHNFHWHASYRKGE